MMIGSKEVLFLYASHFFTVSGDSTKHEIKYLPTINLHFELPENYPACKPPSFTLSCQWLTLNQVCMKDMIKNKCR